MPRYAVLASLVLVCATAALICSVAAQQSAVVGVGSKSVVLDGTFYDLSESTMYRSRLALRPRSPGVID